VSISGLLAANVVFFSLVLASTGWQRKGWAAILRLTDILMPLLVISRLTDRQLDNEMAEAERKANQSASGFYFPGWPSARATERALAFAKRVFGRRESG
jgi:hypothetical protein